MKPCPFAMTAVAVLISCIVTGSGYAQDKGKSGDGVAQLYNAARKEGTVIIWGPTDAVIYQKAQEALNKKYPGITVLKAASKTGRVLIVQDEPVLSGYAPYVRCLLDELPEGKLVCAPCVIAGADQFLPFWDERPFLPSIESVMAAAKDLLSKG